MITVVGIFGDARYARVSEPMPPTFYTPDAQATELGAMTFEVRTAADPALLAKTMRDVVRAVDNACRCSTCAHRSSRDVSAPCAEPAIDRFDRGAMRRRH